MCNHVWKKVEDVHVCLRCGLTRTPDGKYIFDKKITNYRPKKRR